MEKKTLEDLYVKGKKVIVRVDYNVPMDDKGNITDAIRIESSLPTLKYLLKNKAAVIILAHLGRPKGQVVAKYSLKPVAECLSKLLKKPVAFASDCIGPVAEEAAAKLEQGQVLLLENLRFHPEEEANDMGFSEKLASLGDMYVNDGFGVSHRAHASVEGITHFLPAASGYLLTKEIKYLGNAVDNPKRPFAAIIGGAKVSDKINVINSLIDKADVILIGGGMANTFLAAEGYKMGHSLVETECLDVANKLIKKAKRKKVDLALPTDLIMAEAFDAKAKNEAEEIGSLNQDYMALDIGPKTAKHYAEVIKKMQTIVWNGPMGVFEMDAFCKGTETVAKAVAANKGITIVGGGDSAAAVKKLKLTKKIKHVSTGGGASLEYLEGKVLPGVAALDDLRTPFVAGNWKCHKNVEEALDLACEVVKDTALSENEVAVFPPFTALETVADAIDATQVGYGAQDLFYEDEGAFTGAVSGPMLAEIGTQYVIVGHSERRQIFGDTDAIVAKKIQAAYRNDLLPILCVGETAAERKAKKTISKVTKQVTSAVAGLTAKQVAELVIAYEPLWAIGSGNTAKVEDALEVAEVIRAKITKLYDAEVAKRVRILYGGSVKPKNAHEFHKEGIDGVLVGGASLKAKEFVAIANKF